MPRACSICTHPEAAAIDKALVAGTPYRRVAQHHGASPDAVNRHRRDHLPQVVAAGAAHEPPHAAPRRGIEPPHAPALALQVAAQEARTEQHAIDVQAELARLFDRVNLLFDACDAWLRDAGDATRYDIGPRAGEVAVTYFEQVAPDVVVRRKATLQELLDRLTGAGVQIDTGEFKHADPRKLILSVASQLQGQIALLADLMDRVRSQQEVERFQRVVLDAVRDEDAGLAARIFERLRLQHAAGLLPR